MSDELHDRLAGVVAYQCKEWSDASMIGDIAATYFLNIIRDDLPALLRKAGYDVTQVFSDESPERYYVVKPSVLPDEEAT